MRNVLVVAGTAGLLAALVALDGCPTPTTGCIVDSDCTTAGQVCHDGACVSGGGEGEGALGEGEGTAAGEGEGTAAGEGEGTAAGEGEGTAAGEGEGAVGEGEGAAGEGEGAAGEGEGEGEGGGAPFVGTTIADIYAAPSSALDITLTNVVVTNVIAAVPSDPAGFFLQDGPTGPAVFVDTTNITTTVNVGDSVSGHVTTKTVAGGQTRVTAMDSVTVTPGTPDVAEALRQDVSAVDVVTGLAGLESEAIALTGTIAAASAPAGGSHVAFAISTEGNAAPDASKLVLRMPSDVATSLGTALNVGCQFSMKGNMVRFNAKAEPSIFAAADLTGGACSTSIVSAAALGNTSVVVNVANPVDATTITNAGTQFVLSPSGTVQSAAVNGNVVTLTTTAALPDGTYTVTTDGTVKDDGGVAITGSAQFTVGGASSAPFISEIDYDNVGSNDSAEFVEITNPGSSAFDLTGASLVLVNGANACGTGGAAACTSYKTVALSGSIPAGGRFVVGDTGVANVNITFSGTTDQIQNGAPDALALVSAQNTVIDGVVYEGTAALTFTNGGASLTITTTTSVADSNTNQGDLCRTAAASAFAFCTTVTPGT